MNRLLTITVTACLLLAGLAATASPARADWRSLSGLLPAGANVVDIRISPDSKLVAYVADADTAGMFELYVVPIGGGTPRKLNAPLPPEGDVAAKLEAGTAATAPSGATPGYAFQFMPDSKSVVYVADQELDKRSELYRVALDDGTVEKLNGPLVDGGNVVSFQIHPNSQYIVYTADQDTDETYELYSVAGDFGPFKRNGVLPMGGDVGNYAIDPHSTRVLYSADQDTNDTYELFSVAIVGGSAPLKLNPPLVLTGDGDKGLYAEFAVSPTAPVVVFNARQAGSPGGKLYRRPTDGGLLTPLGFNVLAAQRLIHFRISPSGDRVVFNVGTNDGTSKATRGTLYSTAIGGGGVTELTEPADALFGVSTFRFTPNGERVVYGKWIVFLVRHGNQVELRVSDGTAAQPPAAPPASPPASPQPDPPASVHRTLLPLAQR